MKEAPAAVPAPSAGPVGVVNTEHLRVGLVQITNSFSGQNYLPYAVGLLLLARRLPVNARRHHRKTLD